jgi:hypothetical protein
VISIVAPLVALFICERIGLFESRFSRSIIIISVPGFLLSLSLYHSGASQLYFLLHSQFIVYFILGTRVPGLFTEISRQYNFSYAKKFVLIAALFGASLPLIRILLQGNFSEMIFILIFISCILVGIIEPIKELRAKKSILFFLVVALFYGLSVHSYLGYRASVNNYSAEEDFYKLDWSQSKTVEWIRALPEKEFVFALSSGMRGDSPTKTRFHHVNFFVTSLSLASVYSESLYSNPRDSGGELTQKSREFATRNRLVDDLVNGSSKLKSDQISESGIDFLLVSESENIYNNLNNRFLQVFQCGTIQIFAVSEKAAEYSAS